MKISILLLSTYLCLSYVQAQDPISGIWCYTFFKQRTEMVCVFDKYISKDHAIDGSVLDLNGVLMAKASDCKKDKSLSPNSVMLDILKGSPSLNWGECKFTNVDTHKSSMILLQTKDSEGKVTFKANPFKFVPGGGKKLSRNPEFIDKVFWSVSTRYY